MAARGLGAEMRHLRPKTMQHAFTALYKAAAWRGHGLCTFGRFGALVGDCCRAHRPPPTCKDTFMNLTVRPSTSLAPGAAAAPAGPALKWMWAAIGVLGASVLALGATGWLQTTDLFWGDEAMEELHETLANALMALAALHAAAALVMGRLEGVNLVKAMVTGVKVQK
eukprot:gene42777-56861_t